LDNQLVIFRTSITLLGDVGLSRRQGGNEMAMDTGKPETHASATGRVVGQAGGMVNDIKNEVKHEVSRIYATNEPVDPSQSDHVMRRHVSGLSITFFVLIGLFLVAAIAGIAMFGHH
jgi:hypothetical protein